MAKVELSSCLETPVVEAPLRKWLSIRSRFRRHARIASKAGAVPMASKATAAAACMNSMSSEC